MNNLLKKLTDNCNQILFIELCGLLHDIGKLSKAFLEYRQKWQKRPNGYNEDPHDHAYFNNHDKGIIPSAFDVQIKEIGIDIFCEPDFSIIKAVHDHVDPKTGSMINKMLKAADGVDSAIDRNNPLWSAEQFGSVFKSNVFGYEHGRIVTLESQEKARKEIYRFLNQNLDEYFKGFDVKHRDDIFDAIKKAFEQGVADTTRPSNDTTLWEHSYAVASILKVLAVHNLLNDDSDKKIYKFQDVRFGILGIGWDGIRFMSYGQRIGDIVGRKEVIESVTEKLKELVEHKYPIGNEIYKDNDGIYFIVPVELTGNLKEIWVEVEKQIHGIAIGKSEGELQPHIVYIDRLPNDNGDGKPCYINTLTSLCTAIQKMKGKISYRYDSSAVGYKAIQDQLEYKVNKTVCPICRLRPVKEVKLEDKDDDAKKKICKTCEQRRTNKDRQSNGETVYIDEIVDDNRRATLIVARFGLEEWLNGKMIRSLFVTEAKGLETEVANLGNVKQFEGEEIKIKKFLEDNKYVEFNYARIKADIDAFSKTDQDSKDRAWHTAFLYDQRVVGGKTLFRETEKTKQRWDNLLKQAKNENTDIDIYNLLNAKTPTPSTILDIWDTTLEFSQGIANNLLKALLPESKRLKVGLEPQKCISLYDWGKGTLEAEIIDTKQKIELLYVDGNIEVVGVRYSPTDELMGKRIRIIDKEESRLLNNSYKILECKAGTAFIPCRTMTVSPNLFMAIVPADRAVEISALIYQKYIEQFGKVMGRLPFSIGNIFFDRKIPMFVVLDAGKRMIANFDVLAKKAGEKEFFVSSKEEKTADDIAFNLKCKIEGFDRTLRWKLPHKLGNCKNDYHHPYFTVKEDATKDYSSRKNYFKTVAGDVIHFTEAQAGDVLKLYPNYYDFEFLDSNARRHDITLDRNGRRKSNVADIKSKPFLLDELNQKIICLWDGLLQGKQLKGITDTKLRNLQSLWLTKYQEWVEPDKKNKNKWKNLVACSIEKEFSQITPEQHSLLMETIDNGLFFDTLELYLGILKERIDEK